MEENYVIKFEAQEPTFYSRLPKMAIMELDPYELALYCNYKQTASEGGKCFKSNLKLAVETGMSERKIQDCRASLEAKGYIAIQRHVGENGHDFRPPTIRIVNVWAKNHALYSNRVAPDATGVARPATGVAPDATKEEPYKKNQLEENTPIADFGNAGEPSALPGEENLQYQTWLRLQKTKPAETQQQAKPVPGNLHNEDLTWFMKKVGMTVPIKAVEAEFINGFTLPANEVGGKPRPFESLAWHLENVIGFREFFQQRTAQIMAMSDQSQWTPQRMLSHMKKFDTVPAPGSKGWRGWFAWRDANPSLCNPVAQEEASPTIVYYIDENGETQYEIVQQ